MKKKASGYQIVLVIASCLMLCLLPRFWGEGLAFGDYEFQGIKEAHQVKKAVFGLAPEIRDFWEEEGGIGPDLRARVQKLLLSKRGTLEGNPFYHLLIGEIHSLQQQTEKAQDEWRKARIAAGGNPFLHWLLLEGLCTKGHYDEAGEEIRGIMGLQEQKGPDRLPLLASQAVRLAEELQDRHQWSQALGLTNLALFLDARSAEAQYVRASILWRKGRTNVLEVLKDILSPTVQGFKEIRSSRVFSVNLLSAAVWMYFSLFLLLGAVLFLKYEPLLRHQVLERTKIVATRPVRIFFFALLYLMPLFLFLGWNWLLFFCIFLIFPYCVRKERVILSLLILLLFALPYLYRFVASSLIAQEDAWTEAIGKVENGLQGEGTADFLSRYAEEHPEDPLSHFYFGLVLKGKGLLEKAEKEFQTSLTGLSNPGAAYNNLANIYFLQKRYQEAEEQYLKAIEADPQVASTHLNLSLLYAFSPQRLRVEEARAELEKAEKLEPGITGRVQSYAIPHLDRGLLFQNLPGREFCKRIWAPSTERDLLAESLWGGRIRFVTLRSLVLFPFLFLFVLWASHWVRARGSIPKFCQQCGKVICDLCLKEGMEESSCAACHAVFHLREGVSPQDRIERLICQDRRGEKEKIRLRLLSFLPGAPALYLGRSLRGMGQSAIFLFLLISWSRCCEIIPTASLLSRHFPLLRGTIFLAALLLLLGASVIRGRKWSS